MNYSRWVCLLSLCLFLMIKNSITNNMDNFVYGLCFLSRIVNMNRRDKRQNVMDN